MKLKNDYTSLYFNFLKFGLFTIGGGLAMIPLIEKTCVEDKHWLEEEEMVDCVAISQSLPGVIAINAATYIGYHLKGLKGSICSTLGVITPSLIIMMLVVLFLQDFGENPFVEGALFGIKSGCVGLILYTLLKLGKKILKDAFAWIMAIASFAIIAFLNISVVWVILGGALLGIAYSLVFKEKMEAEE
ncbi:MAG: chromate transporter [Clostridia bacterium]|nr:chromate transporter [Clostridia bacterium]